MSGTQRWMPDTCTCVLIYSWHNAGTDAEPNIITSNYLSEKKCDQHRDLPNGAAHFNAVQAHNRSVNEAIAAEAALPLGLEPSPCGGSTLPPG